MKRRRIGLAPGATLLILVLVVLCVSLLGALTLLSARNDLTLAQRSARVTEETYRLSEQAERSLAELAALCAAAGDWEALRAALPERMTLDAQHGLVVWQEKENRRALECTAALTEENGRMRARWQARQLLSETEDIWN